MAFHLYNALQSFFSLHPALAVRPLFIAGESYGGKYVPSIAHYILQAKDMASNPLQDSDASLMLHSDKDVPMGSGTSALLPPRSKGGLALWRRLPIKTAPPVFKLAGIAIGNGLTDPRTQVQTMAETAYFQVGTGSQNSFAASYCCEVSVPVHSPYLPDYFKPSVHLSKAQ
jgi:vitellogenic carboxypeptidase-like protein